MSDNNSQRSGVVRPSFLAPRGRPGFGGAGGRGAGRGGGRPRPPYGIPPYIWMTAGGSTLLVAWCYYEFLDEVPLTRRQRWIATSTRWEQQLGDDEYKKLLQTFRGQILPSNHRAAQTVQRVGSRIATASQDFAQQYHLPPASVNKPYTYTVVRSDQANAFVLPGNHVFVLTGLFRYVHDEDDLAAVLGHEVAHNLARHAGEKISGSVIVNLLARLSLLLDPTGLLIALLLPAATLFRELPHSRTQEAEADQIGAHLAAMACYDPRAAARVFANMKEEGSRRSANGTKVTTSEPPEFLSTHPSHESRIANFDQWMPDAMQIYQADAGERCRNLRRDMEVARQHAARVAAARERSVGRSGSGGTPRNQSDW